MSYHTRWRGIARAKGWSTMECRFAARLLRQPMLRRYLAQIQVVRVEEAGHQSAVRSPGLWALAFSMAVAATLSDKPLN